MMKVANCFLMFVWQLFTKFNLNLTVGWQQIFCCHSNKYFKMKKYKLYLTFFSLLLLNLCIEVFGLQVKGPILIIGAGDEDRSKLSSNYKVQDIFRISDVKIANGKIYVIEFSSCQLFVFDLKGNLLKKVGGVGGGKNEFYNPQYIESVDSDIWISDFGNSRIQVFSDKGNMKTIRNGYTVSPSSLAVSGQHVLMAPLSLAQRSIIVLDKSGNYKFSIPFQSKYVPKKALVFYFSERILPMPGNRVLIAFRYYPIVAIIESDLKTIKEYDLSDYYYAHMSKDGFSKPPEDYAAMSFSNGPGNSILLAACSRTERKCSRVLQFSQDLKKIGEWDPGFSLRHMSYYPAKNLLAVVNVDGEVLIYEIH